MEGQQGDNYNPIRLDGGSSQLLFYDYSVSESTTQTIYRYTGFHEQTAEQTPEQGNHAQTHEIHM